MWALSRTQCICASRFVLLYLPECNQIRTSCDDEFELHRTSVRHTGISHIHISTWFVIRAGSQCCSTIVRGQLACWLAWHMRGVDITAGQIQGANMPAAVWYLFLENMGLCSYLIASFVFHSVPLWQTLPYTKWHCMSLTAGNCPMFWTVSKNSVHMPWRSVLMVNTECFVLCNYL